MERLAHVRPDLCFMGVWGRSCQREKGKRSKRGVLTAKWCPGLLVLPGPLPGRVPGRLPLPLLRPLPLLPLFFLLLHRDVKLILDAWVLLVENDL